MLRIIKQLAWALAMIASAGIVGAAEVRLKPQARCAKSLVLLGDVAEVFAADEFQREQLLGIELGPAPLAGGRRIVRIREVQDALWMRGINLSLHQFSGAEQAEIMGAGEAAASTSGPALTPSARERAERSVAEAVVRALQAASGSRDPYQVRITLTDAQTSAVLAAGQRLAATGGAAPFTGTQQLTVVTDDGQLLAEVTAEVALPPGVVVVQKNLPAGSIIHAADLALKSITAVNPGVQPFYTVEEVVGLQTTWSIPAGTIMSRTGVQRPQVVRRGDAVTLYARTAGIRVRTTVRAREAGAMGDLITVESLADRTPLFARITGVQEAEVYADPAAAQPPVPATAAVPTNSDKFGTTAGGSLR